jgi:hypothetical protein
MGLLLVVLLLPKRLEMIYVGSFPLNFEVVLLFGYHRRRRRRWFAVPALVWIESTTYEN